MRLCLLLLLWSPPPSWFHSSGSAEATVNVKCKNEKDQEVDWYILYKAPDGQSYTYISTNGEEKTNKPIAARDGVLANTLKPMLEKMETTFGYLSYNDQPPDGSAVSGTWGHSKGVVMVDSQTKTALWLTHSTPEFPKKYPKPNSFWPTSGNRHGQTFMCVTLTFDQLKAVGTHLQNIHANTYAKHFDSPQSFPKEIIDAANNKGPDPHFLNLKVGNTEFQLAAKGFGQSPADGDLYVQLSRVFKSNMDAKTWCQQDSDKDYCVPNQHKVINVLDVKVGDREWAWTKDHSKWAITTDNNVHWTCIADVNRADKQYQRLGGALCIKDEKVTNIFKGFIKETQPCDAKKPKCDSSNDDMEALIENLQEIHLNDHADL